jgi:hypothetical protein
VQGFLIIIVKLSCFVIAVDILSLRKTKESRYLTRYSYGLEETRFDPRQRQEVFIYFPQIGCGAHPASYALDSGGFGHAGGKAGCA